MEDNLHTQWASVKTIVEGLELDLVKNQKGVVAAGIRLRRALRAVRKQVSSMIKATVEQDKVRKAARVAKKTEKV